MKTHEHNAQIPDPGNRDQLYLLKPGFHDQGKMYYCPGCAEAIGLLGFYPSLKRSIDVHYVDYPRARPALATVPSSLPLRLKVQHGNGRAFVREAREIGAYLSCVHGIGIPH